MERVTCRSCHAPMVFVMTEKRRRMPLDAERDPAEGGWVPLLVPDGNVLDTGRRMFGARGRQDVPVVRVVPAGLGKWRSHFATCPKGKQHRRAPRPRATARNEARG